jgi:hypothetical protein
MRALPVALARRGGHTEHSSANSKYTIEDLPALESLPAERKGEPPHVQEARKQFPHSHDSAISANKQRVNFKGMAHDLKNWPQNPGGLPIWSQEELDGIKKNHDSHVASSEVAAKDVDKHVGNAIHAHKIVQAYADGV